MIRRLALPVLLVAYALVIIPFSNYMQVRPVEVKLGYLPHPQILKVTAGEHATTVAGALVTRVLFYFGTILEGAKQGKSVPPEFFNMFKTVQGATELDPYNSDAYYFAQAVFTWDLGRVREVNVLLEEGMNYRTWDASLPFYLSFNHAYFLKDYARAAEYMRRAATISGDPLYASLASRYFYEAAQPSLGLVFLESMIKGAKNMTVRQSYEMRRDALKAVILLEEACRIFRARFGNAPQQLEQLVSAGILERLPDDPYGGTFYLDPAGKVRSSSKFIRSAAVDNSLGKP